MNKGELEPGSALGPDISMSLSLSTLNSYGLYRLGASLSRDCLGSRLSTPRMQAHARHLVHWALTGYWDSGPAAVAFLTLHVSAPRMQLSQAPGGTTALGTHWILGLSSVPHYSIASPHLVCSSCQATGGTTAFCLGTHWILGLRTSRSGVHHTFAIQQPRSEKGPPYEKGENSHSRMDVGLRSDWS